MNIKKLITIFVALIAAFALIVFLFFSLKRDKTPVSLPLSTPSVEKRIEEKFNGLIIPEDVEKIELKNVSGGEGVGIATRSEILADLPPLEKGESYQAFLGNGSKTVLLGVMRQAKGGYIIEYNSSRYPGYNQIIINKGSVRILEGSF